MPQPIFDLLALSAKDGPVLSSSPCAACVGTLDLDFRMNHQKRMTPEEQTITSVAKPRTPILIRKVAATSSAHGDQISRHFEKP